MKLMSTYCCETHQYGGYDQLSTSRATSPNLVKSAIESADVPIKPFNLLFFSIQYLSLLLAIILMYIWVPIALSFRFFYSSSVLTTESRFYILKWLKRNIPEILHSRYITEISQAMTWNTLRGNTSVHFSDNRFFWLKINFEPSRIWGKHFIRENKNSV